MGVKKRILENINQVALRKHRVNLSIMDDIEDQMSIAYGSVDFIEEAIEEAESQAIKARDIIRFEMGEAMGQAEALIEDFESEVEELGLNNPPELQEFRRQLGELEQEYENMKRKLYDAVGYETP